MKKIIAIPLLMLALSGAAQQLENKLNIYFGYTTGTFLGCKTITEGNFTYPSLYGNMGGVTGYTIKSLYRYKPHLSIGLGFEKIVSSRWQNPTYSDYNDVGVTLYALHPTLQLHTPQAKAGLRNWIKAFIEVKPSVGTSKVIFEKPIFDVVSLTESVSQPSETNNIFFGIGSSVGLEVTPTNYLGIFASYSYSNDKVASKFYIDTHITTTQLTVGLFVKFLKNKRFIYE